MTTLDTHAIVDVTREATREQAMRIREIWRMQLRLLEDLHNLPRSFQTKAEMADEIRARGGQFTPNQDHHNR